MRHPSQGAVPSPVDTLTELPRAAAVNSFLAHLKDPFSRSDRTKGGSNLSPCRPPAGKLCQQNRDEAGDEYASKCRRHRSIRRGGPEAYPD
jgi:hypothetical protein